MLGFMYRYISCKSECNLRMVAIVLCRSLFWNSLYVCDWYRNWISHIEGPRAGCSYWWWWTEFSPCLYWKRSRFPWQNHLRIWILVSLFTKFVSQKRYFGIISILYLFIYFIFVNIESYLSSFGTLHLVADESSYEKIIIITILVILLSAFWFWLHENLNSLEPNSSFRLCWVELLGPNWWKTYDQNLT